MTRSRIVAILAIGPLALVLVLLSSQEGIARWLANEPVVVVTGQVGTPHAVGGPVVTVEGAQLVDRDSEAAGYADAPEGAQVVVVDLRIDEADDIAARCSFRLEATVGGVHAQWLWDGGASEVTGCYAEEGSLSGPLGFVVPAGAIEDARLLVGGEPLWLGVPLTL